jgi:hypothetical protein
MAGIHNKRTDFQPPRDVQETLLLPPLLGGLGLFVGMLTAAFLISQISMFKEAGWTIKTLILSGAGLLQVQFFDAQFYTNLLLESGLLRFSSIPYIIAGAGGAGATAGIVLAVKLSTPLPGRQHVRGQQLLSGKQAIKACRKAMKKEISIGGAGMNIHPQIQISADRETTHFFICGSSGGGKTTIIQPMINEIVENEEKLLIYDNKGLTETCPDKRAVILAPWDKRCWAWDICADIENSADARTFASHLIPENKNDPIWANGAQAILSAVITDLIVKRQNWTLKDVLDLISNNFDYLKNVLKEHAPDQAMLLIDEKSKQSQSFLMNISAHMSKVRELAHAWEGKPKISIRRWLFDEEKKHEKGRRTLILQANKRYADLQAAYIKSILDIAGGYISSPEMSESKSRRIWFCFDEVAKAGKLDNLTEFLEIGRSKGVCVILGMQNLAQIREIYGENIAEIWSSQCSTTFICRSRGEKTKEFMSKQIGKEVVRKWQPGYSGGSQGRMADQRQEQWLDKEEYLLLPSEIETHLKKDKKGIWAIMLTGNEHVYHLRWPYDNTPEVRKSYIFADWTKRRLPKLEAPEPEEPENSDTAEAQEQEQEPEQEREQEQKQEGSRVNRFAPPPVPEQKPKQEKPRRPDPAPTPEPEHEESEDAHKEIAEESMEESFESVVPGLNEVDIGVKAGRLVGNLLDSTKPQNTDDQAIQDAEDEEEEEEEQC